MPTDVGSEAGVARLVDQARTTHGDIDLFCSNAGICTVGGVDVADEEWQRIWQINVMAHIYATRAVLPRMLARGQGYLLQTVSAAGLLTQIGAAPYSVTKHAALGLAEWLSITYADQGIKVSCLCPQGVRTDMLRQGTGGIAELLRETALEPEAVAEAVVAGLAEDAFSSCPIPRLRTTSVARQTTTALAPRHAPPAAESPDGQLISFLSSQVRPEQVTNIPAR